MKIDIMRKILTLVLILVSISAFSADNAGIYLKAELNITEAKLKSYAPKAQIFSQKNESGAQFIIYWPDVKVTLNTRSAWLERDIQINGMLNWVNSTQTGSNDEKELLKIIPELQNLIGSVIEPRYDKAGKVSSLIKAIATDHSGIIFSHQSFYSKDGRWLVGSPTDTKQL